MIEQLKNLAAIFSQNGWEFANNFRWEAKVRKQTFSKWVTNRKTNWENRNLKQLDNVTIQRQTQMTLVGFRILTTNSAGKIVTH